MGPIRLLRLPTRGLSEGLHAPSPAQVTALMGHLPRHRVVGCPGLQGPQGTEPLGGASPVGVSFPGVMGEVSAGKLSRVPIPGGRAHLSPCPLEPHPTERLIFRTGRGGPHCWGRGHWGPLAPGCRVSSISPCLHLPCFSCTWTCRRYEALRAHCPLMARQTALVANGGLTFWGQSRVPGPQLPWQRWAGTSFFLVLPAAPFLAWSPAVPWCGVVGLSRALWLG